MKKKIVALCLVVAMLAIAIVGGTLAYFTDNDAQTNVFTIGEIKIDLYEEFNENNLNLLPAVEYKDAATGITQWKNQIDKLVYVENEGTNDAFVRVHIAVPAFQKNYGAGAQNVNVIATDFDDQTTVDGKWIWGQTSASNYPPRDGGSWNQYRDIQIDGVPYKVYVVTYETALKPGESTVDAIKAVHMDSTITQDDIAIWNSLYGEGQWSKVYVYAEAVQADGFDDAVEALNTAFGTPGTYGVTWTASVNVANEALLIRALVDGDNATLTKDIKTTDNIILNGGVIDGNGKVLDKVNNASNFNAGIAPTGGTIKNINVKGATDASGKGFRAIYVTKGLSSNLYIDGAILEGTYAINIQDWEVPPASTGALIVEDTTLNGWVSYDGGITGARFTDSKFVTKGDYAVFRPYIDTIMTGCSFVKDYTFGADANPDLIIELNQCYIDTDENGKFDEGTDEAITAANFATCFTVEEALKGCSVIVDGVKVVF